ncbi:hypothetical protein K440DRAFT_634323 [Wilcoxina mikolae CBS 423.85]|nr:hypothetical protein K440DRAFT_634323 [Wilcoxina mikolae CBS 423.85]
METLYGRPTPWSLFRLHPYLALSLVCRTLHNAVETYTEHLLLTAPTTPAITPASSSASPETTPTDSSNLPVLPTHRRAWLEHLDTHCFFCGVLTRYESIV